MNVSFTEKEKVALKGGAAASNSRGLIISAEL